MVAAKPSNGGGGVVVSGGKENAKPTTAVTKTTKKLQAALENRELMDCLADAGQVLLDSANTLIAGSKKDRAKAAAYCSIKELGTFLRNYAPQGIRNCGLMSPIACVEYLYSREEANRKKDVLLDVHFPKKHSSPKRRMDKFIRRSSSSENVAMKPKYVLPKRQTLSNEIVPGVTKPKNGQQYSKKDIVDIYSKLRNEKDKSKHANVTATILEEDLVPVSKGQLYEIITQVMNDNIPHDSELSWGNRGRPPMMCAKEISKVAQTLNDSQGSTLDNDGIRQVLFESLQKRISGKGLVPITGSVEPSKSTIRNYTALLANHPGISIKHSCVSKTQTRFIAENSWMSSVAFTVLVAATHFIGLSSSSPMYESQQKRLKSKSSDGAKQLFELVWRSTESKYIFVVLPHYVFSTDDTVTYIYQGEAKKKSPFVLVGSESLQGTGSRANYAIDNTKAMNGMRVKLTFTFSASGNMADPFILIVGLSEHELPKDSNPTGMLALWIRGLCIGGMDITVGSDKGGWLALFQNDCSSSPDKMRYKFYRDRVQLPFLHGI